MIDTGATCTLLRKDAYQTIVNSLGRTPLLKSTGPMLTVSGQHIKVCGETEISIDKIGIIRVIVVENIKHKMLIGGDILSSGESIMDYKNRTLKIGRHIWKLYLYDMERHEKVEETCGYPSIDKVMQQYSDVFSDKSDPHGFCNIIPCRIPTGDSPPIKQRPYRAPLSKRKVIEEQIQEMKEAGVIRPSSSPYASPVTLVTKKDGSPRFCVDYRRLNSVTQKDSYPIPLIQDLFDQLGGSTIFTTLDLRSGYWQIPVAEEDIHKTAFICHAGLWEFTRMPFGLCNAPSEFQRVMNSVLGDLIGKCVLVYIDDIVIYSQSPEEHADHLKQVLQKLKEAGLKVKPSKCAIAQAEVELLGYVVNDQGIRPQLKKIEAIQKLARPKSVKEVRSFLGMTGYYRQCIPDYAKIAEPLVRLTRKYERFVWEDEREEAFEKLKAILCSDLVMAYPRLDKPYKLYTDACDYAIGGILVQDDDNNVERVVQYVSHQLHGSQLKWATIEKEAYAVIYCLEKLRPYVWGSDITVFTDHKPLRCLFTKQMNNTKIQRWAVLLSEYRAAIKYYEGKRNIRADMLSRIKPAEVATYDTQQYIDPNAFSDEDADLRLPLEADGINPIVLQQQQKESFAGLVTRANNEDDEDYITSRGLLYSCIKVSPTAPCYPRLVLPPVYQDSVIRRCHKEVGHQAMQKTLNRVRESYVWPGMRKDIQKIIKSCPICRVHVNREQHARFSEMPLPATPMQVIGMDLIGPFLQSDGGNKYILNIIDHCSGWAESYPIPNKSSKAVEEKLRNEFFPRHGIPEVIITDCGTEFNSNDLRLLYKEIGIKHKKTTPYQPSTNGKTERFNRTLKEMLTRLVNNEQRRWENQLAAALTAYRNSVSDVTGFTPFFLLYGRRGRLPLTQCFASASGSVVGTRLHDLSTALAVARDMTKNSRKYNRERINRKAVENDIGIGDTVVVKAHERMTFTSKWDPQYEVTNIRGPVLWLRHQATGKTRVININKVVLVDPNIEWDEVRPRPRRQARSNEQILVQLPINNQENQSDQSESGHDSDGEETQGEEKDEDTADEQSMDDDESTLEHEMPQLMEIDNENGPISSRTRQSHKRCLNDNITSYNKSNSKKQRIAGLSRSYFNF